MKPARNYPGNRSLSPDLQTDTAVVEVKSRLATIRDLRAALVKLVLLLDRAPEKHGYLYLVEPRIGASRLQDELSGFKSALRTGIAKRLHLVVENEKTLEKPAFIQNGDWEALKSYIEATARRDTVLPRADKQSEVFRVILLQWLLGEGPMTSKWLEDAVGCNFRTVTATVDRLGPAIRRYSDRRIELKYFPEEAWHELLIAAPKVRATILYEDRSDQPRSPDSLFQRLNRQRLEGVAVGGVLGASRIYPDLDITGPPRLDLTIRAPGKSADLSFVQQLDPALKKTRNRHKPARLALHFVRRVNPFFETAVDGGLWADPVECLLDLNETRLTAQASAFAAFLSTRAKELNARS